jgi:NADPH:quinone reductase-like Zn-dependent oxidoreductase
LTPPNPATDQEELMKAVVQDTYGSPDVLELRDIDKPVIGDDDVLVRVQAAGVDPGVWHLMTGLPYLVRIMGYGLRKPKVRIRGRDVAGRVEAVGRNVTRFHPGDEVFGSCDGSFAEYVCAREDKLAPKPANLTFEQAAAVPISGLTALQAIRDKGQVQPGQKVLIIGAAGGVGTFGVQLAKAFGAEVTGVCSTTKVDLVRSIRANEVIDYTRDDFTDGARHYDLILDTAGRRSLSHLRRALTPRGDARDRRRQRGRTLAWRLRSPDPPGAHPVVVREPEAAPVHLDGKERGSGCSEGAHRSRQGHADHRQDVPPERGPRGHPALGRGTRLREGRHHRVSANEPAVDQENTMKAVVYGRYGSPDVLQLTEIDEPVARDDQVLVRVRAASLNPADWHFMRGLPYPVRMINGLHKPRKVTVLGSDLAGQVEAVGNDVTHLRPGEEVFGRTRAGHRPDPRAEVATGGCAEYACVSDDLLGPKPANLTFEQAAAVPLAALTALQALRDRGDVQPGRRS